MFKFCFYNDSIYSRRWLETRIRRRNLLDCNIHTCILFDVVVVQVQHFRIFFGYIRYIHVQNKYNSKTIDHFSLCLRIRTVSHTKLMSERTTRVLFNAFHIAKQRHHLFGTSSSCIIHLPTFCLLLLNIFIKAFQNS